ncbi:MAG: heavy-metal-associated domain-containing protein [bacterium]|nr:heavy-metal-associated domain-containing protein [bacterium]
MQKTLVTAAVIFIVSLLALISTSDGQVRKIGANLVEVTVTGSGLSETEAISDAKRRAVEKGAGAYIYSQSKTDNFVLVKDTILARSAGYVQKFTLIGKPKKTADGAVELRAKVVVSIKGIEDTWGVVTNLLTEMGRPKIMVAINERIDGWSQEASTLQTGIENMLLKSGFLLVNNKQIKAIDRKNMQAAIAANKPDVIQAIAKQYGAQLFITGTASATSGGVRFISGIRLYRYGAICNVTCFRSDTAQVLSSRKDTASQSDRNAGKVAAFRALGICSLRIAPKIRKDILRFWMDVFEGRGEVQLVVEKIKAVAYFKLKKALKGVKGVKQVNGKFASNVATISIQCETNAEKIAEALAEQFEGVFEITDISQNVIKATYIKK